MERNGSEVARLMNGASVLLAAGVFFCDVSVASADIGGTYVTANNAATPFVMECVDPQTNVPGFCLYAIQDLGVTGTTDHPYPVTNVLGFFSTDHRNWSPRGIAGSSTGQITGVVFTESQITVGQPHGFVPANARHLSSASVAVGGDGNFYLYVSDVSDASPTGVHTSSQTAVAVSSNPFGNFLVLGRVHWAESSGDVGAPFQNHARVFKDFDGQRYLIWADGDVSNCGGLTIAALGPDMMTIFGRSSNKINFGGSTHLGFCPGNNHPFVEAPLLFHRDQQIRGTAPFLPGPYTLVFSGKPTNTPYECTSDKGQPGTNLEVVAYATSDSVMGPYIYQGILMCGSSTEATNHAAVEIIPAPPISPRVVITYHDGVQGSTHKRKLHAECLYHNGKSFAAAMRTTNGFTDCLNGVDAKTIALRSRQTGGLVSAPSNGSQMIVNRWAAGPWERFRPISAGNTVLLPSEAGSLVSLWAQSSSRYVCADIGTNHPLRANKTSNFDPCVEFTTNAHPGTDLGFTFTSDQYGTLISDTTGSVLYCDAPGEINGVFFDVLSLGFPD